MKKLVLLIITLLCIVGCSAVHQYPDTITAEQLAYVQQKGEVDGEKYVELGYDSFFAFSLPESDSKYKTTNYPLIPREKREEVALKSGIPNYALELQDIYYDKDGNVCYSMNSILKIMPTSPVTGLKTGDKVTYEIALVNTPCSYEVNNGYDCSWNSAISLEEIQEILGVTFEPSEYIVK